MKKITLGLITILTTIVITTLLIGCNNIEPIFRWYDMNSVQSIGGSRGFQLVIHRGETIVIGPDYFSFSTSGRLDFDAIELGILEETHDNVVLFYSNTLKGVNNGRAVITARVSGSRELRPGVLEDVMWGFIIGEVFVIDKDNMTEIWTADDLHNIRYNLNGSFILRANIDLSEWGNWEPIGRRGGNFAKAPYAFKGIFINPKGFVISNLSITNGDLSVDFGLFGYVKKGYISGVKLSNLYIQIEDCQRPGVFVGAIAGAALMSILENNHIDGQISGGSFLGGLVGSSTESIINGNSFNGIIESNRNRHEMYIGGLVGSIGPSYRLSIWHQNLIINNFVNASITGIHKLNWGAVGGIIGRYSGTVVSQFLKLENNIFAGYLTGPKTDYIIGQNYSLI